MELNSKVLLLIGIVICLYLNLIILLEANSSQVIINQMLKIFETHFFRWVFKNILHEFYLIAYEEYSTEFLPERVYLAIYKRQLDLFSFLVV